MIYDDCILEWCLKNNTFVRIEINFGDFRIAIGIFQLLCGHYFNFILFNSTLSNQLNLPPIFGVSLLPQIPSFAISPSFRRKSFLPLHSSKRRGPRRPAEGIIGFLSSYCFPLSFAKVLFGFVPLLWRISNRKGEVRRKKAHFASDPRRKMES